MKKLRNILVYLMIISILLPNFSVLVKEGHAVATTTSETEEEEDLSYYFYNLKDVLSYLFYQDKIGYSIAERRYFPIYTSVDEFDAHVAKEGLGDVVVFGDENSDVYIDFKKRYPNAWVKFANEDYYTSENLTELLNENVHTVLFDEEYIDIALDETGFRQMYEWASEVRTDYSFQMFCSKKCLYTAYTQQKKGISIGMLYDDKTKTLMINDQFYLYENDFKDGETDEYLNSSTLLLEDPYSVETIKYTPFGVPKRVFYNGAGNVCEVMPPTSRSETYAIEISYYWPHVKNVYFSDTVSAIAGVYFKKCNELENVVGKNIIYVAAKTFEETEADEINFENLEVIQTYAFYKSTIRNFVAKHIDTVYECAFKECNVEHIDLSHILYLYSEAFLNCKIKEVVLGRIDEIPVSAFEGSSVEKVDLTNVESVGSRAFAYANIQELVIPNECESIGKYAFEHNNIKKLVFEKRSTKLFIEERAFAYNEIENDITIDGDIMQCDAACFYNNKIKRVTLSNVSTIKHTLFSDNQIEDLTWVGDSTVEIEYDAFKNNKLAELQLQSKVNMIGASAFASNNLSEVTINGSTQYGEGCFSNNKIEKIKWVNSPRVITSELFKGNKLAHIELPSSINKIESQAFASNDIVKMEIPKRVSYIGEGAFANNKLLKECVFNAVDISTLTIAGSIFSMSEQNVKSALENVTIKTDDTASIIIYDGFLKSNDTENVYAENFQNLKCNIVNVAKKIGGKEKSIYSYKKVDSETSAVLDVSGDAQIDKNLIKKLTEPDNASDSSQYTIFKFKEYKMIPHQLSFDTGLKNVSCDAMIVFEDDNYVDLPVPEREHYTFEGWYIVDEGIETKIKNGDLVNIKKDVVAIAKWKEKTHNVIFDPNDGNCDKTSITVSEIGIYPELPVPTKLYYTFDGWYLEESRVVSGDPVTISSDITLKAKWNHITHKVSFDPNGSDSSCESIIVNEHDKYVDLPTPKKDHYVFEGWYLTKENGSKEKIANGDLITISRDVTLIAKWGGAPYTVTFNAKGGILASGDLQKTVYYKEQYGTLPIPTKSGYSFAGWYLGNTLITSNSEVDITTDSELVATYEEGIIKRKVVFDVNGGQLDGDVSKTVIVGEKYGVLPMPKRNHYTFIGWYNGVEKIEESSIVDLTQDTTFIARWEEKTYKITLDADGGTVQPSIITVSELNNTSYSLPVPTKQYYKFVGWYLGEEQVDKVNTSKKAITGDVTFVAKWERKAHKITFKGNSDWFNDFTKKVYEGDSYGELPVATKEKYEFGGWFLDGIKIEKETIVQRQVDIELIAKWIPVQEDKLHKVTFVDTSSSNLIYLKEFTVTNGHCWNEYFENEDLKTVFDLECNGYKLIFKGWIKNWMQFNDSVIDPESIVDLDEDLILYAYYEKVIQDNRDYWIVNFRNKQYKMYDGDCIGDYISVEKRENDEFLGFSGKPLTKNFSNAEKQKNVFCNDYYLSLNTRITSSFAEALGLKKGTAVNGQYIIDTSYNNYYKQQIQSSITVLYLYDIWKSDFQDKLSCDRLYYRKLSSKSKTYLYNGFSEEYEQINIKKDKISLTQKKNAKKIYNMGN